MKFFSQLRVRGEPRKIGLLFIFIIPFNKFNLLHKSQLRKAAKEKTAIWLIWCECMTGKALKPRLFFSTKGSGHVFPAEADDSCPRRWIVHGLQLTVVKKRMSMVLVKKSTSWAEKVHVSWNLSLLPNAQSLWYLVFLHSSGFCLRTTKKLLALFLLGAEKLLSPSK